MDYLAHHFGCFLISSSWYTSPTILKLNRQSSSTRACQRSLASSYFLARSDGWFRSRRRKAPAYREPNGQQQGLSPGRGQLVGRSRPSSCGFGFSFCHPQFLDVSFHRRGEFPGGAKWPAAEPSGVFLLALSAAAVDRLAFSRRVVILGCFGNDGDCTPGDFELDPVAASETRLPTHSVRYDNRSVERG